MILVDTITEDYSAVIGDDTKLSSYIANNLKHLRKEARMTQSELAAKLNVTKSYISRIENGFITPSVTVFYRIIDALDMRVEIVKPIG